MSTELILKRIKMTNKIQVNPDILELIKAEYINEYYIQIPDYNMHRIKVKGNRFYVKEKDGKFTRAPSVTTIIGNQAPASYGLSTWYKENSAKHGPDWCDWYFEQSAGYGTYLHYVFGRLLRLEKFHFNKDWVRNDFEEFLIDQEEYNHIKVLDWYDKEKRDIMKDVYGFWTWVKKFKIIPLAIEYPMMSSSGSASGTVDLIAKATIKDEEVIIMVDYKSRLTGFYETDIIQLFAYAQMWNDEHPERMVKKIYSYCCRSYRLPIGKTVVPYQFKDHTESELKWKWGHYLTGFHMDKKNLEIPKTTEFKDVEIDINSDIDDMFVEVDPLEFTKETEENV
jgi:hypothetical protein